MNYNTVYRRCISAYNQLCVEKTYKKLHSSFAGSHSDNREFEIPRFVEPIPTPNIFQDFFEYFWYLRKTFLQNTPWSLSQWEQGQLHTYLWLTWRRDGYFWTWRLIKWEGEVWILLFPERVKYLHWAMTKIKWSFSAGVDLPLKLT